MVLIAALSQPHAALRFCRQNRSKRLLHFTSFARDSRVLGGLLSSSKHSTKSNSVVSCGTIRRRFLASAGMRQFFRGRQKADQDDPPAVPIMPASCSRKTFPSGIKAFYNPEDSVTECVRPPAKLCDSRLTVSHAASSSYTA